MTNGCHPPKEPKKRKANKKRAKLPKSANARRLIPKELSERAG